MSHDEPVIEREQGSSTAEDGRSSASSSVDHDRLRRAIHDSPAAEVATARGDRPETFPLTPFYDEDREAVIVTSPPAYAGKVDTVREHPRLSLLFYAADEPFLLHGRGRVRDDDLEANAAYVRDLVRTEPASEKRDGFTETASLLDSRIGRFLFGWYALRIVVEIEPVRIEPVDARSAGALPPWPEQGVDPDEAASYDRLTLTTVEDGWPRVRTVTGVRRKGERLLLDGAFDDIEDGPGCLLAHWHTPDLKRLGQRLFRGGVSPTDEGRVAFDPGSSVSMRNATPLDRLRFVWEGKRRTRAYFRERSG